jgi:hypothetical protein
MPRVSGRVEDQVADPWDYFVDPPGKGTGVAVAGRVDPELKHMISVIVQSRRTKFDTENDYVRSAVVWFTYDKFKKFHEAKLDEGVQTMMIRIHKAQHLGRLYDLQRFKNANSDVLTKMWAMGAEDDALGWFGDMLREADSVHARFGKDIRKWVTVDPRLTEIHQAWVRAGKELAAIEARQEEDEQRHSERGRPAGKKKPRKVKS